MKKQGIGKGIGTPDQETSGTSSRADGARLVSLPGSSRGLDLEGAGGGMGGNSDLGSGGGRGNGALDGGSKDGKGPL